jgi:hypothetical protein
VSVMHVTLESNTPRGRMTRRLGHRVREGRLSDRGEVPQHSAQPLPVIQHDVVVEVLVCGQSQHWRSRLPAVGQGTIADNGLVEAPLVLLAHLGSLSLSSCEVRPDLRLVAVVRDHRVRHRPVGVSP